MHQSNHKEEDFFDLLDRPEGVVPKNKNFEATPLTLGQKIVQKYIPSQHKDPKRAAGQERGVASAIDFANSLIPKTKKDLAIDLALTAIPFGHIAKKAKPVLTHGTKLLAKKFGRLLDASEAGFKGRGKEIFKAGGDPKKLKELEIKHGFAIDEAKKPTRYITHGMQKNMRVYDVTRKGGGPYKSYSDLPGLEVNTKNFKSTDWGSGKSMFIKDGQHEIQEKVVKRVNHKENADIMRHTMTTRRRGGQPMKDDLASMSFETRQADGVTYIEGIQMSSGVRASGSGGTMGLTRLDLPEGAASRANKASIRLLSNVLARAPKNSVLIVDDMAKTANTLTRDSLLLLLNAAGKYAKRILIDKNRRSYVRPKYEHTGSARNLDELSSEDFAEKIMANLEKANRKGKVHGTMDIRAAAVAGDIGKINIPAEGHSISALRIELAAAFGVPVSHLDDFMGEVTEEKFEDRVMEQDAPIFK
jgi:hypothetical protein